MLTYLAVAIAKKRQCSYALHPDLLPVKITQTKII